MVAGVFSHSVERALHHRVTWTSRSPTTSWSRPRTSPSSPARPGRTPRRATRTSRFHPSMILGVLASNIPLLQPQPSAEEHLPGGDGQAGDRHLLHLLQASPRHHVPHPQLPAKAHRVHQHVPHAPHGQHAVRHQRDRRDRHLHGLQPGGLHHPQPIQRPTRPLHHHLLSHHQGAVQQESVHRARRRCSANRPTPTDEGTAG
jgi:hypothetical protein